MEIKMDLKKGFTLMEIIVAVTIFLVIILIFIHVFDSIIKENRISIEKARMSEYLSLIEKVIKDELNASNLEVDPDTWFALESQNPVINPKFYPTSVIQPNIFQESINISQNPLVYIHPNQNNDANILAALQVFNNDQAIRKLSINTNNFTSLPLTLINVVNGFNPREVRWYYVLNQNAQGNASYSNTEDNVTTPQTISNWTVQVPDLINLSTQVPQYDRRASYRIRIVVSRIRIDNNNIPENVRLLHGTYWQSTPNNRVFDPISLMIYTSIWLERDNQNNRRILELRKSFLINLKYKKII